MAADLSPWIGFLIQINCTKIRKELFESWTKPEIKAYVLIRPALLCPDNHASNPIIVRGPFVVCVKTDLHEGGLEENIRMLNLDETFQNYIHFG